MLICVHVNLSVFSCVKLDQRTSQTRTAGGRQNNDEPSTEIGAYREPPHDDLFRRRIKPQGFQASACRRVTPLERGRSNSAARNSPTTRTISIDVAEDRVR